MRESAKPQDDHPEPTPAGATPPEQNSEVPSPAPTERGDALGDERDQVPPIEASIEKDIGAQSAADPSSAPDAETQCKKPTGAKAEAKPANNETTKDKATGKTKDKTKGKTKAQPRTDRARSDGTDKRAAGKPGAGGEAGNATAADQGTPIVTYLRGTRIEPATSPPAGTLPPQLEPLFPDMLSVAAVLAVTAATAGRGVHLGANKNGEGSSAALRVAVIGEERHLPQAVMPMLQAAYALEQEDVRRWSAEKQKIDLLGAADAARRRAYRQMWTHAGMLGLAEVTDHLDLPTVSPSTVVPRPRLVLRDPGQKDVTRALEAADRGILLVDGRRMPTMVGFGVNYDMLTANLLNAAAAGHPLELADPRLAYCIRMRPVSVSAIGVLTTVDIFSLHKATVAALAGTLFAPAEENSKFGPTAGAVTTLTDILACVRGLAAAAQDAGSPLRLSAPARKTLEQAKTKMARMATEVLPPLAHYYAAAADLTCRIAVVLHLLDHAASTKDPLSLEVGKDVVLRAVSFVEQCVLPAACSALAATSVAPEVRDARRILSFIQLYCSAEFPLLTRRDVIRIFQRSMSVAAVDRALRRLVADGLLAPSNPDAAGGGGHVFQVHEAVFSPDNQLPDLVTDPRRPRQ
jgi:hypothetical protein